MFNILWVAGTETCLLRLQDDDKYKKEKFVLSVAYSPDSKLLACGAMDGTVALFDVQAGKLVHVLEGHYKPVRSIAFTPDSNMLLTACDDMHTHLYDVKNAALVEAFSGTVSCASAQLSFLLELDMPQRLYNAPLTARSYLLLDLPCLAMEGTLLLLVR